MPKGITALAVLAPVTLVCGDIEVPGVVYDSFDQVENQTEVQFSKAPALGALTDPPFFCVVVPRGY